MKKIILTLVVLVVAAPAMADLSVTAVDQGGLWVDISYDAASETELPRAFGLDITVDAGVIEQVDTTGCEPFGIYMGTISIVGSDVNDYGSPVAPATDAGALGGLGTAGITIEMGSLYEDGVDTPPAASGLLIKVKVSEGCNLSIAENVVRGGIVMEDAGAPGGTVTLNGTAVAGDDCYTGPQPAEWAAVGKPDCWCASTNPRQCYGDADGLPQGRSNYWVSTLDLGILIAAWNKPFGDLTGDQICADFDHISQGRSFYRVSTFDLGILIANWNQANLPAPTCP